ncbi:MAG TPA: STAS domain-containing protein [Bryobacteraceae bacterium]|jgi:anti-sigma B factor antagonist
MDLHLDQREKEGIQILDLRGHLEAGDSEATLRTRINALVKANALNVILNLAEVTRIDADGLEALVFCYTQIQKCGGALKLARLNIEHLTLNVLTKLNTVFEVFTDEHDAVNSFFPDRAVRRYDILEWVRGQEKAGWS